jgi:hypothetical protein
VQTRLSTRDRLSHPQGECHDHPPIPPSSLPLPHLVVDCLPAGPGLVERLSPGEEDRHPPDCRVYRLGGRLRQHVTHPPIPPLLYPSLPPSRKLTGFEKTMPDQPGLLLIVNPPTTPAGAPHCGSSSRFLCRVMEETQNESDSVMAGQGVLAINDRGWGAIGDQTLRANTRLGPKSLETSVGNKE